MSRKAKIILFISVSIFIISNAIFTIYIFTNTVESGSKTGTYYYKIKLSNEDGQQTFKWDIAISNKEMKRDVVQNEKGCCSK